MSEFKPLFSTPEVGTFKPAPSTKQYAVEQAASRNPEHTSEFESIRRPESESSSPPIPTEDQSHDAQDDAGEHELPAEPDVDSHDPMLLPEAVEDMLEQARLEGIEEGRRQAEDQLAEAQGMLEHLNNGLSQLDDLHRQTLRATAADIGAIVTKLTRKVLYDGLVMHPNALTTLVDNALNAMPEDQKVWISAHPEHLETLKGMLNVGREIEFIADETIEAGFRIQNKYSSIDSTLATIMSGIQQAVQQWQEST